MTRPVRFQSILGVRFLVGTAQDAIDLISQSGGFVVVPAAPALKNLTHDRGYREALSLSARISASPALRSG
jgi:hypothetical protein